MCARIRPTGLPAGAVCLSLLFALASSWTSTAADLLIAFQSVDYSIAYVQTLEGWGSITINGTETLEVLQALQTGASLSYRLTISVAYNDLQGEAEYSNTIHDGHSSKEYPGRAAWFNGSSVLVYEGRRLLSTQEGGVVGVTVRMAWNETVSLNATYMPAEIGENTYVWIAGVPQLGAFYQVGDWVYEISDTSHLDGRQVWVGEFLEGPNKSTILWDKESMVALHRATVVDGNNPPTTVLENRAIRINPTTTRPVPALSGIQILCAVTFASAVLTAATTGLARKARRARHRFHTSQVSSSFLTHTIHTTHSTYILPTA